MNAQAEEPAHYTPPATRPAPVLDMRALWPRGFFGTLAYLWDHKLYRFNSPVDWMGAYAAENSTYPWPSPPPQQPQQAGTANAPSIGSSQRNEQQPTG